MAASKSPYAPGVTTPEHGYNPSLQLSLIEEQKERLTPHFQGLTKYTENIKDHLKQAAIVFCFAQFWSSLAIEYEVPIVEVEVSEALGGDDQRDIEKENTGRVKRARSNADVSHGNDTIAPLREHGARVVPLGEVNLNLQEQPVRPELTKLTLGLSSELDLVGLNVARAKFDTGLRKLRFDVRKKLRTMYDQFFDDDEVIAIVNLFFGDIIGYPGLSRLNHLIRVHNECTKGNISDGAGIRAGHLATDDSIPPPFRRFFIDFSTMEAVRRGTNSLLRSFHIMRLDLNLHKQFEKIKREVEQGNIILRTFLLQQGCGTRRGVAWNSAPVRYLQQALGLGQIEIWNRRQRAICLSCLVNRFGYGILPLISGGSAGRLNQYGNQRMNKTYQLLKNAVPALKDVCDLIEEYVYQSLVDAKHIHMSKFRPGTDGKETMLSRLQRAIDDGQAEQDEAGQARGQDEDFIESDSVDMSDLK